MSPIVFLAPLATLTVFIGAWIAPDIARHTRAFLKDNPVKYADIIGQALAALVIVGGGAFSFGILKIIFG